MIAYTRGKLLQLIEIEFVRFCIVGGVGFVINFIVLTLLHKVLHTPLFVAQVVGAEIALFSNFILHDRWTYRSRNSKKPISTLLIQFHVVSWPAILGSALMVSLGVRLLHLSDIVALILSSAIALIWNFTWSKFVIWRDTDSDGKLLKTEEE